MGRRKPYTKVKKLNQIRAKHVSGMGDVVFKGFQCLNSECTNFLFVPTDDISEEFTIDCPICGFVFKTGEITKFYDYELLVFKPLPEVIIEKGEFSILHDDYIKESLEYKYCIICNTLKPLSYFDKHKARKSRHQGECRLCKTVYNGIKNQTRIADQHREAAQKRRMYLDLAGGKKINSDDIFERFQHKCFKCGMDLRAVEGTYNKPLDHTLPAVYLWPLTTENATLLCRNCNGEKAEKWPNEFYSDNELHELSIRTGINYQLLNSEPHYNPEAIAKLGDSKTVDDLLKKYAAYIDEIIKLRNKILLLTKYDFFSVSTIISREIVDDANNKINTSPNIDAM